jgi:SdrD B-like domain/FG-GAP-like repeat/FG-GAP repeat
MFKPTARRFFSGIFGRSDELQAAKSRRGIQMRLERLESRDVPSTTIPLQGVNWTQMGPQPILNGEAPGRPASTGQFSSVSVDSTNPNLLFAASAVGGIWTSSNGGTTWVPKTDQFVDTVAPNTRATVPSNSATQIRAIHRTPADTVYAASSFGGEGFLYLSTDGGATFNRMDLGATHPFGNRLIKKFIVIPDPANPNDQTKDLIYAAVQSTNMGASPAGVYRSKDGGQTWTNITTAGFPFAPAALAFSDVDVDPTNKEIVYASVNSGPDAGVYRITNAFTTNGTAVPVAQTPAWQGKLGAGSGVPFSGFLPAHVQTEISPSLPSSIFTVVSSGSFIGMYVSNDSGTNWTFLASTSFSPLGTIPDFTLATQGAIALGDFFLSIAVDPRSPQNPNQQTIYLGGYGDPDFNVMVSRDSGVTWTHNAADGFAGDPTSTYARGKNGVGPYEGIADMQLDSSGRLLTATLGGIFRMNDQFIPAPISNPPQARTIIWTALNGTGAGALATTQVAPFGQGLSPNSVNDAVINDGGLVTGLNGVVTGGWHSAARFTDDGKTASWTTVDDQGLPFHEFVPPPGLPSFSPTWGLGPVIYDFNFPNIVYRQALGGMKRSDDGGTTWRFIPLPSPSAPGGLAIDPSDGRLLFSGAPNQGGTGDDVWVYNSNNDATNTLTDLGFPMLPELMYSQGAPGSITALGVARQNKVIYVATTAGTYSWEDSQPVPFAPRVRLYAIDISGTFGGQDWVELTLPTSISGTVDGMTPPDPITQILVDPTNQFKLYITTTSGKVFTQTKNLMVDLPNILPNPDPMGAQPPPPDQAATTTWKQLNPAASATSTPPTKLVSNATGANVIALDPFVATNPNDDILYLGTNDGVFQFALGQLALPTPTTNWARLGGSELPNNPVEDLDINTSTGIMSVGLNGRGVWQFQIRNDIRAEVFTDVNGNGILDVGDTPLPGIVVELKDTSNNSIVGTAVTDAQGGYEFRGVAPGTYTVFEIVPGNTVVTTAPVANFTVALRDVVLGTGTAAPGFTIIPQLNIGNWVRASITGINFNDANQNGVFDAGEVGVPGFVIYIDTNGDGTLNWTDGNGNNVWDPGEGEQWTTTDFTGNYTLSNLDPPVIAGAANPAYEGKAGIIPPTFVLREVNQVGWTQTLPTAANNFQYMTAVTSGGSVTSQNFGNFRVGTISGLKFLDANSNGKLDLGENGIANWHFYIDVNNDNIFEPTEPNVFTDASGRFTFVNLTPGTYRVREIQQGGFVQTTPNPADVVLIGSNSVAGLLFGNVTLANFRLLSNWTPIGPQPQLNGSGTGNPSVSGRVDSISTDPTNPNRYFIATAGGGLWRTINGGGSWTPLTDNVPGLTPFQTSPYSDSIFVAPSDPNTIYAAQGESPGGTPGHGIWRSTDGGTTWTLLQGPANAFNGSTVPRLIVDPNNKNLVFAAMDFGPFFGEVFRTTDGGTTWASITDSDPLVAGNFFSDIQVDPTNPNVVYAAIGAHGGGVSNGVYRTSNALSATPSWTLLIGGSSFVPGSLPGNIRLALAPTRPSTIYAAIARGTDADGKSRYLATYRTTDSGVNWTNLVNAPDYMRDQADYDLAIIVSPTNPNVVIAAGDGGGPNQNTGLVVTSNDGGTTWRDLIAGSGATLGPHTDVHALAFDKSGRLLLGSDGGMFRLNNATLPAPQFIPPYGGAIPNWVSLNGAKNVAGGLNTIQFVGIATHPTDPNQIAGGSQDNGIGLFNGNIAWNQTDGGDAGEVVWDFDRPNNVYHIAPIGSVGANNYIQKSIDGGNSWAPATNGIQGQTTQNTLFYPPIIIDPNNSQRLFTGTDKVWVTDNGATSWSQTTKYDNVVDVMIPPTPLSDMMPPIPIAAIGVTRVPDTVLFVSQGGVLFRIDLFFPIPTPPSMMDWVDVSPPGGGVTKIIMDPANNGTVYVVAGGTIWRTTNFGGSWQPLDGAPGDPDRLPAVGTNTLALDPRVATDPNDDILYAGTEDGVYALFNPNSANKVWYRVGDQNLPNTSVRDLDLNTTTGVLSAATYGRGVWQTRVRGLIQGQVFEDSNGNGVFDSGEPVQAGVTIRLLDATPGGSFGAEIATTVTDALGNYDFHSLRAGNYRVVEVPPSGEVQTTAAPGDLLSFTEQSLATPSFSGTITPGITVDPHLIFGNFRTGTISGVKFDDRNNNGVRDSGEPGLGGFVIFSDLNGDGNLQWTDGNGNGVFDPGEGEAWTTSAADGSYTLTGFGPPVVMGVPTTPPPFMIREVQQPNFTQTSTNPAGITLVSGQTVTGINFGNIRNGRISGAIFNDLNGNGVHDAGDPGVPNATVNLVDTSTGSIIRTIQSDNTGNYVFYSLPAGTFEVREVVPTGWILTFPVAPNPIFYTATITASGQLGGFEFGNFKLFTVSGTKFEDLNGDGVRQSGEPGVVGFTIRLTNTGTAVVTNAVTDAFGNYSFPNVGPGNYTIAEVQKTGWTQTSATPAGFQGISGSDRTGRDFGNFRLITVTGNVFNDANGNTVKDNGELGIGGITVRLDFGSNGTIDATTLTDANGNYSFPTLGPGKYTISQLPKHGFIVTTPPGGAYTFTAASSTNPTGLDFGDRTSAIIAVGEDAGNVPIVSVRSPVTKQELFSFLAYAGGFKGGVRVATGYVSNSNIPEIVTAAGPGGGPHVRVFNSQTGQEEWGFFAYASNFTGGVYVAVADVNGDGFDDIITGAGGGGGPHVKVWDGKTHQEIYSFFAYDAGFTGGVRVAAGDVNGDGKADIITGAGPGGGPHVKVFSGANLSVLQSFFAFDASFHGGVTVAGGDFNQDGKADIVVGAGAGGGPHVRIFDGQNLAIIAESFMFESSFHGGVTVAAMDTNFDNHVDLIVGPGPGRKPEVSDYSVVNGAFQRISTFTAFDPTFLGGVFVG